MTNMQLAGRLLTAPRRFFEDLADSPRFALPMWLIVLTAAGITVWFYSIVDLAWIQELQLQANPNAARMTEAQREATARFLTRGLLTWGALFGAIIFVFVLRLLEALYYRVAGRATGHARTYRQWFAFSWWTSTPGLVGVIPSAITLLFATNGQIDPAALQPLSLNAVFFHLKAGEPGYQVLSQVSLLIVASLALTAFGMRVWSRRSWLYSLVITLLPAAVIAIVAAGLTVSR